MPGTCLVLGTDWAGHTQDGLTRYLGFLLSFANWLVWSIFLPYPFSSCCSKIYFNIWEVTYAPLFQILLGKRLFIYFFPDESHHHFIGSLLKLVNNHFPFCLPVWACSGGQDLEPGMEDHGFSELEELSRSTCRWLFLPPLWKLMLGNYWGSGMCHLILDLLFDDPTKQLSCTVLECS